MKLADIIRTDHPDSVIAAKLDQAAVFVLDEYATYAISRFDTEATILLRAFSIARLPHDPTWIEFTVTSGMRFANNTVSAADVERAKGTRHGYLLKNEHSGLEDGIELTYVTLVKEEKTKVYVSSPVLILERGIAFSDGATDFEKKLLDGAVKLVLRFLLLMNTRNRVLAVSEPENLTKLNKRRRRVGKPKFLAARRISLDLTRPIIQAERRGDTVDTAAISAHLVRGHFKLRKTGVFWWSPYARGGDAAEKEGANPQTYQVTAKDGR